MQKENLLSSVPVYTTDAIIGRGATANDPVLPQVNLWICEPSLSDLHAVFSVCAEGSFAITVTDLGSGTVIPCGCVVVTERSTCV